MQPQQGGLILLRQTDVDEVAGHSDVIDHLVAQIQRQEVDHGAQMRFPAPHHPVGEPEKALRIPVAWPECGKRCEMDVRKMGDGDLRCHGFRWSPGRDEARRASVNMVPRSQPPQ